MTAPLNFHDTPIKEIIVSISFDPVVSHEYIEQVIQQDLIQQNFELKLRASSELKEDESLPFHKSVAILKSKGDGEHILVLRRGMMGFHTLNKYERFPELLSKLNTYWSVFSQASETFLKPTNVSLRYINFIVKSEDQTWNDLSTVNIQHPFQDYATVPSFAKLDFDVNSNSSFPPISVQVLTAAFEDDGQEGITLDLTLRRELSETYKDLEDCFTGMRPLKNDIFQRSLTSQTLQKYVTNEF